ncbi:MAG: hypothetical protein AAGI17_08240 [Planctomycetota bacterium]
MHTRFLLAILFAVIAFALIAAAIIVRVVGEGSWQEETIGLLGNLGAELVGIAVTVAVIDWMMERRRLNEQVQQMAWRMLHDVDHAFWVWQGGRREFHLDELIALLAVAGESDPLPPFTEELFVNLGIRASDTLRLQPRLMEHDKRLNRAMKSLAGLAQIKEAKHVATSDYIIEGLKNAAANLAELTGQRPHAGEFTAAKSFRDPSQEAQRRRYRGSLHETISRVELAADDLVADDHPN